MAEAPIIQPDPIPLRQDGALLHFLKELPAWVVLGVFAGAFLTVWQYSHDDFIPRIIDGLIGALLLSLQRAKGTTPTTITADTVNTPQLQTNSMDQATIMADTVSVEKKDEIGE